MLKIVDDNIDRLITNPFDVGETDLVITLDTREIKAPEILTYIPVYSLRGCKCNAR